MRLQTLVSAVKVVDSLNKGVLRLVIVCRMPAGRDGSAELRIVSTPISNHENLLHGLSLPARQ